MRPAGLWMVALSAVCLAAPSDQARRDPGTAVTPDARAVSDTPPDPSQGVVYVCPMDPDVRSHTPGTCRRCGMRLASGIPDPVEFHLDVRLMPSAPAPNRPAVVQFLVRDPWKDRPVNQYNVVHERFFHAFVISEDLEFFTHGHPTLVADGVFQYPLTFPKSGMYRVLGDYYPAGATPQLTTETVFVPGPGPAPPHLARDYTTKTASNLRVSFDTVPGEPEATMRTQMRVAIEAPKGLQRYLGAWAHLLVASEDLIDMMHEHPLLADGGPRMEFEMVFPRPGVYRVWLQLQSEGTVNTVHFDVPVRDTNGD